MKNKINCVPLKEKKKALKKTAITLSGTSYFSQ